MAGAPEPGPAASCKRHGKVRDPFMSRCPGRHAKITSRYEGRHVKPGAPGTAALIGTAAKVVPAGLAHSSTADLATIKATAAASTWVTQGRHAAPRSVYTVVSGNT